MPPASVFESKALAALLLTGGASRRMGFDKAQIWVGNIQLAQRTARLAMRVADPVLEIGPSRTGLTVVPESAPGSGPLAGIGDGVRLLREIGFAGPALVFSTDLPLLDQTTVEKLANWPGEGSVVPVANGHAQPLCARWSADHLDRVAAMVRAGERSLKPLLALDGVLLTDAFDPRALSDADTPAELNALGLDWRAP